MTYPRLTEHDTFLIEAEEGFVDHRYRDVVGVLTEGFGTTEAAGVVNPLPPTCTRDQARGWLLTEVNEHVMPAILATGFKPDRDDAIALSSFGYNEGPGMFLPSHTMGQALRSGSRARISAAFMLYVYAGGRILPALVHRRERERALFDKPESHTPTMHYDWFQGAEIKAALRYDALRRLEHPTRQQRAWLHARRLQCSILAGNVSRWARTHRVRDRRGIKHPAWAHRHAGWRFHELRLRAQGHRIRPV